MANKKKMNNVLNLWKQRSHEGQAPRVALEENQSSALAEERSNPASSMKTKLRNEGPNYRENVISSIGSRIAPTQSAGIASSGGPLKGVIRASGMGVVKSDTVYMGQGDGTSAFSGSTSGAGSSLTLAEPSSTGTPFRTDSSALGAYAPPHASGSAKRRFSEMPVGNSSQSQTTYRDRAAERRSLYGSSSAFEEESSAGVGDSSKFSLIFCFLS